MGRELGANDCGLNALATKTVQRTPTMCEISPTYPPLDFSQHKSLNDKTSNGYGVISCDSNVRKAVKNHLG